MEIQFKYQVLFHCEVPSEYNIIRSFSEKIQLEDLPTDELLVQTIFASFENSDVVVEEISLSHNSRLCMVILQGNPDPIYISIRIRDSLCIGDKIYKLEELDF